MAWLDDYRKANPWANDYSDDYLINYKAQQFGMRPTDFAARIGIEYSPPSDTYNDLKRGVQKIPGAVTGLLDIPVAALTGRPMVSQGWDEIGNITGFQPGRWAEENSMMYSPERKQASRNVDQAWQEGGFGNIAEAYWDNPSHTIGAVVESLPAMVAGGVLGRSVMGLGSSGVAAGQAGPALPGYLARTFGDKAGAVAAGIGEGGIAGGMQMDLLSDNPNVDPRMAALASAGTAVGVGALGYLGGRVANRLGLEDIETTMAGGARPGTSAMPLYKRVPAGAGQEAFLEELPQSLWEQGMQNFAEDKPFTQGMARAGVEGTLAGGVLGGVMNLRGRSISSGEQTDLLKPETEETIVPPAQEGIESRPVFQDDLAYPTQPDMFGRAVQTPDGYVYDPSMNITQRQQPQWNNPDAVEQPTELTQATDFSQQMGLPLEGAQIGLSRALPYYPQQGKKSPPSAGATPATSPAAPVAGVSSTTPAAEPKAKGQNDNARAYVESLLAAEQAGQITPERAKELWAEWNASPQTSKSVSPFKSKLKLEIAQAEIDRKASSPAGQLLTKAAVKITDGALNTTNRAMKLQEAGAITQDDMDQILSALAETKNWGKLDKQLTALEVQQKAKAAGVEVGPADTLGQVRAVVEEMPALLEANSPEEIAKAVNAKFGRNIKGGSVTNALAKLREDPTFGVAKGVTAEEQLGATDELSEDDTKAIAELTGGNLGSNFNTPISEEEKMAADLYDTGGTKTDDRTPEDKAEDAAGVAREKAVAAGKSVDEIEAAASAAYEKALAAAEKKQAKQDAKPEPVAKPAPVANAQGISKDVTPEEQRAAAVAAGVGAVYDEALAGSDGDVNFARRAANNAIKEAAEKAAKAAAKPAAVKRRAAKKVEFGATEIEELWNAQTNTLGLPNFEALNDTERGALLESKTPADYKRISDIIAKARLQDADNAQPQRSVGNGTGTTIKAITKALSEWFFTPAQMAKKVTVVQSWDQLDPNVRNDPRMQKSAKNDRDHYNMEGYHGTTRLEDGGDFSSLRGSPESQTPALMLGVHIAADPAVANRFASYSRSNTPDQHGRVLPLRFRAMRPLVLDTSYGGEASNKWRSTSDDLIVAREVASRAMTPRLMLATLQVHGYAKSWSQEAAEDRLNDLRQGKPVRFGMREISSVDEFVFNFVDSASFHTLGLEDPVAPAWKEAIDKFWKESGYDSIQYQNTSGSETKGASDKTAYIVPPEGIRSQFAKFDPANRGSSNLLHSKSNATTQAFVLDGHAYLIADNIDPGEERSVFMHEVGSHLGLTTAEENQLAKRINAWAYAKEGTLERTVYDKVQQRMADAGETSNTELVAYATEEAINAGVKPTAVTMAGRAPAGRVQEFVNHVAKLFMAKVKAFLGVHTKPLTPQDLIDMTYGAAGIALESGGKTTAEPAKSAKPPTEIPTGDARIAKMGDAEFAHQLADITGKPETVPQAMGTLSFPADLRRKMLAEGLRARNAELNRKPQQQQVLFSKRAQAIRAEQMVQAIENNIPKRVKYSWDTLADFFGKRMPMALTNYQLAKKFGDKLKELPAYVKLQQTMDSFRRDLGAKSHKVIVEWEKLPSVAKNELHTLMHDATLEEIHPDLPLDHKLNAHVRADQAKRYEELASKYEAMKITYPKAAEVYQMAKQNLADMWAERKKAYASLVHYTYDKQIKAALAKNDTEHAEALAKERDDAIKDHEKQVATLKGPYFPLTRFGEYIVVAESAELTEAKAELEKMEPGKERNELKKRIDAMEKDKAHYRVSAHETRGAMNKQIEDLSAQGFKTTERLADQFLSDRMLNGSISKAAMDEISAAVMGQFDSATGKKVEAMMSDLWVKSLPEHSALARELTRRGIFGADTDMLRAFAKTTQKDSFYLSRLMYSTELTDTLFKIKENARGSVDLGHIYQEIEKRAALDMQFFSTPIQNVVTSVSWLANLGIQPAYQMINMAQPWMITAPVLAAKYGGKAVPTLGKATADALRLLKAARFKEGKWNPWNDIDFSSLPDDEVQMLNTMLKRGVVDIGMEHDLAAFADNDNLKLKKFNKIMGWATQQVELTNRLTTALATYRLAKEANDKDAVERAYEALEETQLNYTETNAPRLFRQGGPVPFAKIIFQFRKYQQGMLYLLAHNIKASFKGDKTARATLGYLALTNAMAAGALGIPFAGVATMLAGLAGGDDDEEGDAETRFRNWLYDITGDEKTANVLAKGIPALWGMDISKRIGMGDIASPFPIAKLGGKTGKEAVGSGLLAVAGPSAGVAANMYDAGVLFGRGDYAKGAEKVAQLAGKWPADLLKTARYSDEGMTDTKGRTILGSDEFDNFDLGMKALGFATTRETNYYEANNAKQKIETAITERRQNLLDKWVAAKLRGDDVSDIEDKISEFNDDHSGKGQYGRIDYSSKQKALVAARRAGNERAGSGVRYGKQEQKLRELSRYAGT